MDRACGRGRYSGRLFFPLLVIHPAQDACSFGTVSNERYRQLLVEAKRRQATTWPSLVWDNKKTMALLNQRVDDLSAGATSAYERLAAMHAVVRALGGDYRRTGYDVEDPFGGKNHSGSVSYEYEVDLNGIGFFSPFRRQLWVIGGFVFDPDAARKPADIDFIVWFPALFDSYIIAPRSKFGESCPRVPDAALVERLNVEWAPPPKPGDLNGANGVVADNPRVGCRRTGSVRIEMNSRVWEIPRTILDTVTTPDRGTRLSLECETSFLSASGFSLDVNRPRAGDAFYESWLNERKLPTHIFIQVPRFMKVRHTQEKFDDLVKRGFRVQRNENGIEYVEADSRLFALPSSKERDDASAKLYVDCPGKRFPRRTCMISYKYGPFDVGYQFSETQFPQSDWLALDARVRQFVDTTTIKN